MEQVQGPQRVADSVASPVPSLAAVELSAAQLPELAARARDLPGPDGAEAQRQVEQLLATLQPSTANGELLLSMLESGAFGGLMGEDGTPTRARALEALLRLGYPWSIQVQPDDLAWYREFQRGRGRMRLLILLGILGVELLGAGYYWFFL